MTTDHATVTRGVSLPVPCGARPDADDPDPPAWCADDSTCAKDPTRIVEVGGVEVAACGHHADAAAGRAADLAGVELVEPALEPSDRDRRDPFNRSVEDYDADHHEQIASERVTEDADGRRLIADGGEEPVESVVVHDHSPDTRMLDLDAVAEGHRIGIDASMRDLGIDPEAVGEHGRILGTVTRVRPTYDQPASDLWVEIDDGAKVHVYPRRGKVERIDDRDAGRFGVATLVNAGLTFEGPREEAARSAMESALDVDPDGVLEGSR